MVLGYHFGYLKIFEKIFHTQYHPPSQNDQKPVNKGGIQEGGGYKTKFIKNFVVTDASDHDSQTIEQLLTEEDKGQELYADSAYTGQEQEKIYQKKEVIEKIIEKGYRNKPLTEEQKGNNKQYSKTRVRVEHIFGFVENSMNGSFIRTIGIARAQAKIGLMNLTYNICPCVQLKIVISMG